MHPLSGHMKLWRHSAACRATHVNLFTMAKTLTAANSGDPKHAFKKIKGLMIDSTSLPLDLSLL